MSHAPARIESVTDKAAPQSRVNNSPTRKAIPFAVAFGTALVASLLVSNDWIFASLYAGLCAGMATIIVVWLLESVAGRYLRSKGVQIVLPVCVGIACSYLSILKPDRAFERILGIAPPAGVSDLHVRRSYLGGPGDEETMLWFHAPPEVIKVLVAAKSLRQDDDAEGLGTNTTTTLSEAVTTRSLAFKSELLELWLRNAGDRLPVVLTAESEATERVTVFYDRQSSLVIVIHGIG